MQSRFISNIPNIAVAITVSLMLAFMPFTVNLEKYRISLERNEAHAIAPVFAGAAAFLGEMSTAAGFASVGDFVATVVGVTAVGTGMGLATEAGVNYGTEASQNLNNLVDAADYPAWDSLSSSEQTSWGNKDNYDSAKFNSLMAAFELDDAYERYQSAWGSGGAGNFSFSSQEQSSLEQLGEIGQNWANGVPNVIEDILGIFKDDEPVKRYYGVADYKMIDGNTLDNYPSNLPRYLYVNKGKELEVYASSTNRYYYNRTSNEVYWICFTYQDQSNNNVSGSNFVFDKVPFNTYYGNSPSAAPNEAAKTKSYSGNTYYSRTLPISIYGTAAGMDINMQNNGQVSNTNGIDRVMGQLLFGDDLEDIGVMTPDISGYPENVAQEPTVEIYFPESGINDDTTWNDLLTHVENIDGNLNEVIALLQHIDNDLHNLDIPGEPDLQPVINYLQHIDSDLHKFNFYNNGELKVHDQGVFTELSDIYALLLEMSGKMGNWGDIAEAPELIGDFDFDDFEEKIPDLLETISELAPFGSILLLSEMYSIMANYTQIESPELVFPFDFGGFNDQNHELVIDLSWLDDIKPLINFFCIAMLIIAIANATIRIVEIEAAS